MCLGHVTGIADKFVDVVLCWASATKDSATMIKLCGLIVVVLISPRRRGFTHFEAKFAIAGTWISLRELKVTR
jgi:hypothetical protein